jgi:hypothetical protein
MSKKSVWAVPVLFLLPAACSLTPGGGGSTQTVSDTVKAGHSIFLGLELSVWGSGGSIKGRYTDIVASYRRLGESDYKTVAPKLVSEAEKTVVYQFVIPTLPTEAGGEIEYYIDTKFDGHLNHIPGIKKIRVEHP